MLFLCHELLNFLQTCFGAGEYRYHVLVSENVLLCILNLSFVVLQEIFNTIPSFFWLFSTPLIRERLEKERMIGAVSGELQSSERIRLGKIIWWHF